MEASKAELERTREENKALEEENRLLAMRASAVEEEAKKQRGSKMYAEHERLRRVTGTLRPYSFFIVGARVCVEEAF